MHWREYPNFVSTRQCWIFSAHLVTTSEPTRTLRFGYWCSCTKSIQNFQNFRVLTKFVYSRQCIKSIQNCRLLTWRWYRCFRILRRVISRYPSDGYYDISAPIKRAHHVDCCQELLQESEVNPDNFFHSIVTGGEFWIRHYDPPSQLNTKLSKRSGEQDSAKKDQLERWWWWSFSGINDGVLLTEYLPCGITINAPSEASIIERVRSIIVEKGRCKVSRGVVLLHDNAPIHMFTLLFERVASSNWMIVPILEILHRLIPIHCQTWRNFFVRRILAPMTKQSLLLTTISLILIQRFFDWGLQSLHDRWHRVKVSTLNKCENSLSTVWTVYELHEQADMYSE